MQITSAMMFILAMPVGNPHGSIQEFYNNGDLRYAQHTPYSKEEIPYKDNLERATLYELNQGMTPKPRPGIITDTLNNMDFNFDTSEMDKEKRQQMLKVSYLVMSIVITANLVSSLLLLLGVRHRNRFLLLPWILVTAVVIGLCHVWMILTKGPVFMGDLFCVLLFIWAELCVVSHYQNLRDGVREDILQWVPWIEAYNNPNSVGDGLFISSATAMTAVRPSTCNNHRFPPSYEDAPAVALPSNLSVDISGDADLPPPYPGEAAVGGNDGDEDVKDGDKEERNGNFSTPPPSYHDCLDEEAQMNQSQNEDEQPENEVVRNEQHREGEDRC